MARVAMYLQDKPESRNSAPPTPPTRWQGRPRHHVAATHRSHHAYPAADRASQEPTLAGRVHAGRDNPARGALRTHCADRGTDHSWKTDHACPVHESAARCRSLPTPSCLAWRARPQVGQPLRTVDVHPMQLASHTNACFVLMLQSTRADPVANALDGRFQGLRCLLHPPDERPLRELTVAQVAEQFARPGEWHQLVLM